MVASAYVHLWGKRVGAIAWDPEASVGSFEFEPSFLTANWELSPVKMPLGGAKGRVFSFPELKSTSTFKGLPGLLADILPDKYGNALINTWLTRQGRPTNSLNPVETLCFIGSRGMGALEVEPAYPKADDQATKIEVESLIDVAEQILSGRKKFGANMATDEEKALVDILKIGSSAGGARAKALITYNTSTGEIKSGQTSAPEGFTHWIIKFDGVTDAQFGASSGYGRVEMAYYLMARDAGIEMTESRLLEENGRAHFMTQRFDRTAEQGKVHMQSFCAMRHFDFNEVTMYSYEQLFETMRFLRLPYPQAEQLYRRMVFNVMGRNCDDHTKNFAFMMDKSGQWKLSPAFDVCHAYRPGSEWVSQHALSINGKRAGITKNDLLAVARQMNVKKAASIIQEIAEVVSQWDKYSEKVGVEKVLQAGIGKTLQIIR